MSGDRQGSDSPAPARERQSLFSNTAGPSPGMIGRTARARAGIDSSPIGPKIGGTAAVTPGSPSPGVGAQEAEEDVKPKLIPLINLTVRDNANTVSFKMKRERPLEKLMQAACKSFGRNMRECRWLFDGERVKADDTPDSVCVPALSYYHIRD